MIRIILLFVAFLVVALILGYRRYIQDMQWEKEKKRRFQRGYKPVDNSDLNALLEKARE